MGILKKLLRVGRAIHPPCEKCPYRLGLVVFVQSPCPMCRMSGYSTYDTLMRNPLLEHGKSEGRM